MGIKGLTTLIKTSAPSAIQTQNLHHLTGKKVAIDASLFMYKMLINMRNANQSYLTSNNGKVVSHITGIFYKTANYLALNITPIYVFDGKPPSNKGDTIKARQERVATSKLAMEQATSEEDKNNLEKQTIRLTKEHVDDIKQLLELMGVSYVQAHGEAEAYASEMCRKGMVDYVVTEDMDTLAFGCPRMIRTCLDKSIKRKDIISIIDLDVVLQGFELTYDEFVDLCILCGCDYCPSIPKVGTVRSYNYIQNYRNIEALIESKKCNNIPEEFIQKYDNSRKLFEVFKDKIDLEDLPMHTSSCNFDKLNDYLINENQKLKFIKKLPQSGISIKMNKTKKFIKILFQSCFKLTNFINPQNR